MKLFIKGEKGNIDVREVLSIQRNHYPWKKNNVKIFYPKIEGIRNTRQPL